MNKGVENLDNRGENHHNSKLTEKQIQEIRSKYVPRKYTQKMLAKEYDISEITVRKIISRKLWGWL